MWYLQIDESFEKEYTTVILPVLKRKVETSDIPDEQKNILNEETLKELLVLTPDRMEEYCLTLMYMIVNDFSLTEWEKYLESSGNEYNDKYAPALKILSQIFDYDKIISQAKKRSYWISNSIGHNTCTYCNRQYTFTVVDGDRKIARPAFDHWYPKEYFPLLALSLYNLIPCCSICNSSIKGSHIFSLDTHIHPYINGNSDPEFKFIPCVSPEETKKWSVCLKRTSDSPKVDNTIKAFALDEMYSCHGDLEVKDIIDFAYTYSDGYLKNLFNKVLKDFSVKGLTQAEVYRMMFATELDSNKFANRPLSKLKKDILEYLGII